MSAAIGGGCLGLHPQESLRSFWGLAAPLDDKFVKCVIAAAEIRDTIDE